MKKFLFCLFILYIFLTPVTNGQDYYALGVAAFNSAQYASAVRNFEYAVKLNPHNVNARYYLAQAYLKQNFTDDAKKQYNKIIMLAPDSEAARLSQKGLSLIRKAELGISDVPKAATADTLVSNYLLYVLTNGKARKWKNFPLSVYIPQSTYKQNAQKAFQLWQSATNELIKFNFTENKNAQIIVTFRNALEKNASKESFVAGYSKPYYKDGFLNKSEISILTVDPETKEALSGDMIFFSTLHEIGHSLGFNGHSPYNEDVMASAAEDIKEKLTARDINTVKMFYTLDENQIAALSTNGDTLKLYQLQEYVKQFPNNAVSWSNLGDYYRAKADWQQAIQNYKKAISIEPDNPELYNLLGSAYHSSGDKQNAYLYLKQACSLDRNNEYYLYQFIQSCTTEAEKTEVKKYVDDFLRANPGRANDEMLKI